jgi:hypothetical protein
VAEYDSQSFDCSSFRSCVLTKKSDPFIHSSSGRMKNDRMGMRDMTRQIVGINTLLARKPLYTV